MSRVIVSTEEDIMDLMRRVLDEKLSELSHPPREERKPLTKKEVGEHLGISLTTIHKLMESGHLQYFNIGKSVRFRWADVEAYIKRRG